MREKARTRRKTQEAFRTDMLGKYCALLQVKEHNLSFTKTASQVYVQDRQTWIKKEQATYDTESTTSSTNSGR